jgi:hypothetical protein
MNKGNSRAKSASELRPGSKDEDQQAWSELYILTEHWQSDIKFFHYELNFLNILVDKYFTRLMAEEENVSKVKPVAMKLSRIEDRERELDQKITKHLQHIQELMENPSSDNSQKFRDEHVELEIELANFLKDFRATKSEVFGLTEQVLKSEKAKHLLAQTSEDP